MLLTLSKARREAGDTDGERRRRSMHALALDPYYLPALLAKAQRYDRIGASPSAAHVLPQRGQGGGGQKQHWPEVFASAVDASTERVRHGLCSGNCMRQLDSGDGAADGRSRSSRPGRALARGGFGGGGADGALSPARQPDLRAKRCRRFPFYEREAVSVGKSSLKPRRLVIREELKRGAGRARGRTSRRTSTLRRRAAGGPVARSQPLAARWSHYSSVAKHGEPVEAHLAAVARRRARRLRPSTWRRSAASARTPCSPRSRPTQRSRRILGRRMPGWLSTCRSSCRRNAPIRVGFEHRIMEGRRAADLRRHNRAHRPKRQRSAAGRSHLRRLEPASGAGRTRARPRVRRRKQVRTVGITSTADAGIWQDVHSRSSHEIRPERRFRIRTAAARSRMTDVLLDQIATAVRGFAE
jgi:hypothetical protein